MEPVLIKSVTLSLVPGASSLILFWEDDLTLVFQELRQPVSVSVPERKALRAGWRDHGCRGDYHQQGRSFVQLCGSFMGILQMHLYFS